MSSHFHRLFSFLLSSELTITALCLFQRITPPMYPFDCNRVGPVLLVLLYLVALSLCSFRFLQLALSTHLASHSNLVLFRLFIIIIIIIVIVFCHFLLCPSLFQPSFLILSFRNKASRFQIRVTLPVVFGYLQFTCPSLSRPESHHRHPVPVSFSLDSSFDWAASNCLLSRCHLHSLF